MMALPKQGPESVELEETIRRHVLGRTWGRVHRLQVDLVDGRIIIRGRTATYYAKQLALEAALEALNLADASSVELDIQVGDPPIIPYRLPVTAWSAAPS